jgi:hypothetical protein
MEPRPEASAESTRWRELRALFEQVAELPEPERRAALERACASDPARIEEVLALVRAAEQGDGFLVPPPRAQPARVGRFVLERILDRSGTGTLHLAREPGGTPVALRVVPLSERADEEVARLRRVTRVLMELDHPALARTLETGLCTWPSGGSAIYFASEHVPGAVPLDDFARASRPSRKCLELFLDACDALASVHAHGLHHGDLSALSVLVDEHRRVRVVDLGPCTVFPGEHAPDAARDRIALAELLQVVLRRLEPEAAPWHARALEVARGASGPIATPELESVGGFAAALRGQMAP